MEDLQDPTVVLTALKDWNMLVGGPRVSSGGRGVSGGRRLDFRVSGKASFPSSPVSPDLPRGQKRNLDSLVGFDVTKRFREKDHEIVNTRATVTRLEGRLHEMELAHKKSKLEADAEMKALHHRQQRDKELIDDLQHKLKKLQKAKEEAQESVKSARAQWDTASLDAGSRVVKLQQTHLEQTAEMQEKITSLQEKVLSLEKEVAEKSSKMTLAEEHAENVEAQLKDLQERLKKAEEAKFQAEDQKMQLDQALARIKELEIQQKDLQGAKQQQGVFEAAMRRMPVMEKELAKVREDNKFFRDTARNTQLLEEQLTSALQQVKQLERRCEDAASQQAKAELYKQSLDKFETIVSEEFGLERYGTPEDLRLHLTQLRQGDKALTDSLAQLRASHKSLESSRQQEVEELNFLKTKLNKMDQTAQLNAQQLKRLQRRLFLVTKERDGLKAILSSYESELTINYSAVGQERVRGLERQVELYKQEVDRLHGELQEFSSSDAPTATAAAAVASSQRKEDAEKIAKLEEKVLGLEEEAGKLRQEKEVLELRLEHRTLKGDYDPTKTKVLHFRDNPHTRALENRKTEIEKLQKENEALQERIRLLEQGETEDLTQRVGVRVAAESHKEIMELQEKVSQQERKNKRLMEVFQRKSREMREMVYRLTGYRMDMLGENQYKLMHMYAESPDDYFLFEHTPAKELQLLETEFSSTLDDLIDAYLRHENSYPAFLSAVTLDLFNRQTKYHGPSSSEEEEEEEDKKDKRAVGRGNGQNNDEDDDDDDLVILD